MYVNANAGNRSALLALWLHRRRVSLRQHPVLGHCNAKSLLVTTNIPATAIPKTDQGQSTTDTFSRLAQLARNSEKDTIVRLSYQKTQASPPSLVHSIPLRPRGLTGNVKASQPTEPPGERNDLPSPQDVAVESSMLSSPEKKFFF